MSQFITATVDDTRLRLSFARVVEGMKPESVLKIAGEVMRGSIEKTFKEEGSPRGSWPPLAESTKKRYAKKGKLAGHKLLILSSRLKNSITYKVDGDKLTIGTNLKYAAVHQFGSKSGGGRIGNILRRVFSRVTNKRRGGQGIPARPFLVFRPEDPQRVEKAVDRYLGSLVEGEKK